MSLRSELMRVLRSEFAAPAAGAFVGGVGGSGALEGEFDPSGAAGGALLGAAGGYGVSRALREARFAPEALDELTREVMGRRRSLPPLSLITDAMSEGRAAGQWRDNPALQANLRRRLAAERARSAEPDMVRDEAGDVRWNRHTMQSILDGELDPDSTIMPRGDYLLGGAPDPAAVARILGKRGPKKPITYDYRRAHQLMSEGKTAAETTRILGLPKDRSGNIVKRVQRAIDEGELPPFERVVSPRTIVSRSVGAQYDITDLVAAATTRDENGYLPRAVDLADELRGDTGERHQRVIRTQMSRVLAEVRKARAAGRLDDLARRWKVTPDRLELLASGEKAGFSIRKEAERVVRNNPDLSSKAMIEQLAKALDARNADYTEGSLISLISQARRKAGLMKYNGGSKKRGDVVASVLPYLVSGGGLSAIWSAAMASDEGRRAIMQELNSRDAA